MNFVEFSQACMIGDLNVLQYSEQFRDQKDILNWSGLNHAINSGQHHLAMELIQRGYSITDVDIHGRTILMNACVNDMVNVAEYIINQGVDISVVDNTNYDALYYSLISHSNYIANMLLDRDAFKLSKCKSEIFCVACKHGLVEILARLTYHSDLKSSLDRYIDMIIFLDVVDCLKPFMFHVALGPMKRYKQNISRLLQQANLIHSDPDINMDMVVQENFTLHNYLSICANGGDISIIQMMIRKKKYNKMIRIK